MRIAVAGGIAVNLATAATGDGVVRYAAEIETAIRLGLGYTIVVFNDDGYGHSP